MSQEGHVVSCGYGFYGQCGVGNNKTQPNLVKCPLEFIVMVESGDSHCIAIDRENRIFVWGSNRFGQCGILPFGNFLSPILMQPFGGAEKKVVAIACGTSHCALALLTGEVYSFGSGTDGRLGLGDEGPRYAPTRVEGLAHVRVVALGAGMLFTAAVTDKGRVYTWGANRYGQLGLSQGQIQKMPQLVPSLNSMFIEKVACGRSHTLVVTDRGNMFAFGHNMCGQLGDRTTEDAKLPRMTNLPPNSRVTSVSCGYYHSICLTGDGTVYSWGYNAEGALGLGPVLGHQPTPHPLTHSLPSILQPGESVVRVRAGGWHSALITSTGRVITFGLGEAYRLGHGTEADLRNPKVVEGVLAKDVACGGAHTLFLTAQS